MLKCTKCGDRYTGEEVNEWHSDGEAYSIRPFICPDCYDNFNRQPLETQIKQLIHLKQSFQPVDYEELDYLEGRCLGDICE